MNDKAIYKCIKPEIKVDSSGVITATLSTEDEDRDGDIIRASAWQLEHFLKHPVLMANHDYSIRSQIGHWENVRVDHGKLLGEPVFYADPSNPDAMWAEKLARMGKAAFSVGFVPVEGGPRKGYQGGQEFTKAELLEVSIVAIPSNRAALQLMAKGVPSGPVHDLLEELLTVKQPAQPRQKWDSAFMGGDGYDAFDMSRHCIVPGCDDAGQADICVCPEHLKVLMNAPAEPPGGELDEELMSANVQSRGLRRLYKAGRAISASNMKLLHGALDNLHAVHDAHCTDDDCQYADGSDTDEGADKGVRRAMGEGSGAAGGVTVADDGSHDPMTGSHKHSHPTFGDQGGDQSHSHAHEHDGDANHDHAHAKSAKAAPNRTEPAASAPTEPPPPFDLGASLEEAVIKALEAL